MLFDVIKMLLFIFTLISLIYLGLLFGDKPIKIQKIKEELCITSLLIITFVCSFFLTGHLKEIYLNKKEDNFKKEVIYSHEEIFIPLNINSLSVEDYTKELLIDKQLYNIKTSSQIEVTKKSSNTQGLVLYKINIKSNTNKKDLNERIDDFSKNPIYILKEIRY